MRAADGAFDRDARNS